MSFLEVVEKAPALMRLDLAGYTLFQMEVALLRDNLRKGDPKATRENLKSIAKRLFGEKSPDVTIFSVTNPFSCIEPDKVMPQALDGEPDLAPMVSLPYRARAAALA